MGGRQAEAGAMAARARAAADSASKARHGFEAHREPEGRRSPKTRNKPEAPLFTATYDHSELGRLTVASDGESIVGLWIDGQKYFGSGFADACEARDDVPALEVTRAWLDRYFAGDRPSPHELPLNPHGTAFQREVWSALADIPYGEVRTYAEIADEIARKNGRKRGSARAVGAANGRNPISIVLPCHRVVGSDGSLTGYAGGVRKKLWLLRHEGVDVEQFYTPTRGTAL